MKAPHLPSLALFLLIPSVFSQSHSNEDLSSLSTSTLLTLATTHLSSGLTAPALAIYDLLLQRDPSSISTLFKRASVQFAAGQYAKAKEGFREVLEGREGWDSAVLGMAKTGLKLGEWEETGTMVGEWLGRREGEKKVREEILAIQGQLSFCSKTFSTASSPSTTPSNCLTLSSSILSLSPSSLSTRLLRASCALHSTPLTTDLIDSSIGDLSRSASLSPTLPQHLLLRLTLLSTLFVNNGLAIPGEGLAGVKKCLNGDPESRVCGKAFKKLKAVERELGKLRNWVDGGRWAEASLVLAGGSKTKGVIIDIRDLLSTYSDGEILPPTLTPSLSPLLTTLLSTLCRSYISLGNTRKATVACEEVWEVNKEDLWGMVGKGEKEVQEENWQEGVNLLQKAFEMSGRSDRLILEKLQKAQRLLKASTAKDYYKILGVARDADSKTIKRAYRKATLRAHPDKEGGSEKAMAALNEAYEVLSKPELKARFDNGEDPNDPTNNQGQHQGHQHPFGGGFQFQGGQQFFHQQGGGSFRFP